METYQQSSLQAGRWCSQLCTQFGHMPQISGNQVKDTGQLWVIEISMHTQMSYVTPNLNERVTATNLRHCRPS